MVIRPDRARRQAEGLAFAMKMGGVGFYEVVVEAHGDGSLDCATRNKPMSWGCRMLTWWSASSSAW